MTDIIDRLRNRCSDTDGPITSGNLNRDLIDAISELESLRARLYEIRGTAIRAQLNGNVDETIGVILKLTAPDFP